MSRTALVDSTTKTVVDVTIAGNGYEPPASQIAIASDAANIGWIYDGTNLNPPTAPAPTQSQLVAYAQAKQVTLRDAGITVNVGSTASPIIANVDTNATGKGDVSANVQMIGIASQLGQPAPAFAWNNGGGAVLSGLTAAQMMTIAWELNSYVQATQTELETVLTAIANGTITTFAGIDSANWPARSA